MTNAERLALARNKLARLETARRLAWDAGEEQAVHDTDALIDETRSRIADLESIQ